MRSIIKIFISFLILICPIMAFADVIDPAVANIITIIAPDNAKEIIGIISLILVIWTQLRTIIPPAWLAKLPHWSIQLLECLAGNSKNSANATHNDPIHIKKSKERDSDGK